MTAHDAVTASIHACPCCIGGFFAGAMFAATAVFGLACLMGFARQKFQFFVDVLPSRD